jgi:hypothetical protein
VTVFNDLKTRWRQRRYLRLARAAIARCERQLARRRPARGSRLLALVNRAIARVAGGAS